MEILNETPFPTRTSRDYPSSSVATVSAVTRVLLAFDAAGVALSDQSWRGTDECPWPNLELGSARADVQMAICGAITAEKPFQERVVSFRAGSHSQRLVAFGPRIWEKNGGGELIPSAPAPTGAVEMSWGLAYGGTHRNPPGLVEGTGLPGPSTEVAWAANRDGIGFYRTASEAVGKPLPQLEDPMHRIFTWSDQPQAWCWAPLPATSALRMSHWSVKGATVVAHGDPAIPLGFDTQATSPHYFRFAIAPGDPLELSGYGRVAQKGVVPDSPFFWEGRAGDRSTRVAPTLTHLFLFPGEGVIAAYFQTRIHIQLVRRERRQARQVIAAAANSAVAR